MRSLLSLLHLVSFETGNKMSGYSEDLWWRTVWLHVLRGLNYKELLYMSDRSIRRFTELFHMTGDAKSCQKKCGPEKMWASSTQ